MQKSSAHNNIQVKCTMDEPIELLIDKLSTKSTDLYVFWQNYNQMYRQFNQKINENNKLREEIQFLKRSLNQPKQPQVRMVQDPYLKDKLRSAQLNSQTLKAQNDKQKSLNSELKIQNMRLVEEVNQMQVLITQLRQQNSQQRNSIANILQKLKAAQNEISGYSKIYEQAQQKELIIARLTEKEKDLQLIIQQKDDEIQELTKACKDTKNKYQKIIKDSMQSAKETVMNKVNSISHTYKVSEQRTKTDF